MKEAAHRVHPLPSDVTCEQWTEPVRPVRHHSHAGGMARTEPHRFVTDVDPAFEEQVFDIPQR
jgi:hypothetical protein